MVTDSRPAAAMNSANRPPDKKPSFVLKEFLAQKDKSTNDAVIALRPDMYALAQTDDAEAKLKKDTIGTAPPSDSSRCVQWRLTARPGAV